MGFEDTGWIELKNINLLFGRNSTGKSAIIRALLLLKQSEEYSNRVGALTASSEAGVDLGVYQDFVYNHDTDLDITFSFRIDMFSDWGRKIDIVSPWMDVQISFGVDADGNNLAKGVNLSAEASILDPSLNQKFLQERVIFSAIWDENLSDDVQWHYSSELLDADLSLDHDIWGALDLSFENGLIPFLDADDLAQQRDQDLGDEFQFIATLLRYARDKVTNFLYGIVYIGPIRSEPQRFYYVPQSVVSDVGKQGQHAVQVYLTARKEGTDITDAINAWFRSANLNYQFTIQPLDNQQSLYSIMLDESFNIHNQRLVSNLRDVGFGLSQWFPIIVQSLLTEQSEFLIIEQPELHLHPAAQAELADIFILMTNKGMRFLIETHSENLLLRFRRRLAETTAKVSQGKESSLRNEDFEAYFIDRPSISSTIEKLEFDDWGDFSNKPDGFKDFFGQDFEELVKMKSARKQKNRK